MVINVIFNNVLTISWLLFVLEETEVRGENHRHATSHRKSLSHNVVSSTPCNLAMSGIKTHKVDGVGH
jgi:hypothetical protein